MSLTRRDFLRRAAALGGAPLVYEGMTGLGLLGTPTQTRVELSGRVSGVRVLVLGGGLAGLTAAYELGEVGYDCRVLETRARPGGRVFTVRRGAVSEEDGPSQTAAFDDGLYFNAGPMRISHHHQTTLDYCRELQVPLEVFARTPRAPSTQPSSRRRSRSPGRGCRGVVGRGGRKRPGRMKRGAFESAREVDRHPHTRSRSTLITRRCSTRQQPERAPSTPFRRWPPPRGHRSHAWCFPPGWS